jgi:poly(A) polymerase
MSRTNDQLPAPPELPSFRVEEDVAAPEPPEERHRGTGLVRHDARFDPFKLDADAVKVVQRLERAGFQAYLVGGCVRDLLLGGKPKDYDIATSARPEDVRGIFRNCRVIGRRFRLAHVLFSGGKVVEVATFRKNPEDLRRSSASQGGPESGAPESDEEDDILIRSDNVFGDAHEDALRRDFTINALFYDPARHQVLDWCGGMADIDARTIRTIGAPSVRFREDPVRILRAIKFAARLDLGIEPDVYDAIVLHRDDLARAARPRIFEEVLRLLRGGASHRSMYLMWETGVMALLLPELASFLDDDAGTERARLFARLDALDGRTHELGKALDDVVLFTTLLRGPAAEACAGTRDVGGAVLDFLEPVVERIALPRRIADAMRRIFVVQARVQHGRLGRFARSDLARLALDVLEIEKRARGEDLAGIEQMRAELPAPEEAPAPARRPRRRSRR